MRIAHLQACVLEWPPRPHGDPQGSSPLQARHPRVVGHRMPLAQFGVRVDDLRVLHQPVAEVVDDGGDGEDAAETFIKSRLTHDSVLPRATPRLSRGQLRGPNPGRKRPSYHTKTQPLSLPAVGLPAQAEPFDHVVVNHLPLLADPSVRHSRMRLCAAMIYATPALPGWPMPVSQSTCSGRLPGMARW